MARYDYEFLSAHWKKCTEARKPHLFRDQISHAVGLVDEHGAEVKDKNGCPTLAKDAKAKPTDFNLEALTEAVLGREWKKIVGIDKNGRTALIRKMSEEGLAPIGPSFFGQISAWLGTVGGLMQASMLEGYEQAPFDVADLFPTRPAVIWNGGERYLNVIGPAQPAPQIGPGQVHPDARMDFMWVQPAAMKKWGEKLTITKETAWVDITGGQILARAKDLGESLKFRENELALDIIVGTTNNFSLGLTADASATGYNTYGPTINGVAVPNDIVNPMVDPITTFAYSDTQIANLVHPVTGNPINVDLKVALLPTPLASYAKFLNGVYDLTLATQGDNTKSPWPAAVGGSTYPTAFAKGTNPYAGVITPIVSRWLHARHIASATQTDANRSPGLGLTTTGINRWYRMDPARFACRRVAWEANVMDLNPNEFMLSDQGIVAGTVCDIAVMYQILSPYHIQRNKSA